MKKLVFLFLLLASFSSFCAEESAITRSLNQYESDGDYPPYIVDYGRRCIGVCQDLLRGHEKVYEQKVQRSVARGRRNEIAMWEREIKHYRANCMRCEASCSEDMKRMFIKYLDEKYSSK